MISFECDYNNGAHPKVLESLIKYNDAKPTPYGFDEFSERAKNRIREAIGMPEAQIFFLTGGTQTNATTIDSMLYQYEGVICVGSGHINVHEAGAVEFTEHKIITIPDNEGKMEAKTLDKYLDDFYHDGNRDHAVHPGLVYITFPTELGTLYSAHELNDVYQVCQRYGIPLYIDGARLVAPIIAQIDPESSCYGDTQKLLAEIKAQVRSDIDFEVREKYHDQIDIQKQTIECARAVGVAFGKGQQPQTTNILWAR